MTETAAAALRLVTEHLGERPVVAVVYSHSHADHWGGVRGVIDESDVAAGDVQVIAPIGFLEHAVAENVYVGNAMNRRKHWKTRVELSNAIFEFIEAFYNRRRRHSQLDYHSPIEFELSLHHQTA